MSLNTTYMYMCASDMQARVADAPYLLLHPCVVKTAQPVQMLTFHQNNHQVPQAVAPPMGTTDHVYFNQ